MALWKNRPNTYKHSGFIDIPEGDHRVRICRVEVERFSRKRKCFEITLEVSGYHGKLWHHLWYNPDRVVEFERTFRPFFYSFGIQDYDHLAECLQNRGVSDEAIMNIFWNNALGVFEKCCI